MPNVRTHVRIETSVRTNPKFLRAGGAACWLWACGNMYCQDALTDGFIAEESLHFLVKYFGTGVARSLFHPADTITTKDRVGLVIVTIAGDDYVLVDIRMRMLTPRELYLLQGFPKSYVIDGGVIDGQAKRFTKGTQTRLVGNSVPPHLAAAIVRANFVEVEERRAV